MKIYTRTGDDGTTGLFSGGRTSKDDIRVEAYGTVDELNSVLGLARTHTTPETMIEELLERLQNELFVLGSDLATPIHADKPDKPHVMRLSSEAPSQLEALIDRAETDLPPLKHFILPGGTPLAAHLHLARTVCRRAERLVVSLSKTGVLLNEAVLIYLNRLSDLLFVLGRAANHTANHPETIWNPR